MSAVDVVVRDRRAVGRPWGLGSAGAWCAVFAVVHVYWALGGDRGLAESAGVELATTRPAWFVGVGLWGVAFVLAVAAGASVYWIRSRARFSGRVRRRPLVLVAVSTVGLLLLLRGAVLEVVLALDVDGIASAVGPAQTRWSLLLWNPWFVLGGVTFLLAGRQMGRIGPQPT